MKFKGLIAGAFALCVGLPLAGQAADMSTAAAKTAMQSNLTVQVKGIRNDNGVIRVALFNDKQAFETKDPEAANAYRRAKLTIKNGQTVWQIANVPYGVYAIKLYQDEDNSGKLKKNFVGRPQEGVGFSNVSQLNKHAPSFDEAKFTVNQPQSTMTIQMINP